MRIKMVKEKQVGIAILAVALAALLLVTACAPPTTLPPGERVVKIGDIPMLTGGGGTADQPRFRGTLDYARYFNEEKGIPGVTIEVAWIDAQTALINTISGYRVLAGRGVPIIYSGSSTHIEALKPQLEKDQIPFVVGSTTEHLVHPPGWAYCVWATDGEAAATVLDYFMQNWREERPPRLQLFVAETPYGMVPAEEATKYAQNMGFEVLPIETCGYVVLDSTTQLLRIREREADLVYIQNLITAAGPIMRDVERLALQEKMQFAGVEWVLGEPLIKMAPVGVEGFLVPRSFPWIDETEIPGVKTMTDIQMKYHGKVHRGPEYLGGWICAAILCEAVKRALEEVGYENLDGPAVKRALESMKDFDVDGVIKITFGPEDRIGTRDYLVYQAQGGKIVRVSDWRDAPMLAPEE